MDTGKNRIKLYIFTGLTLAVFTVIYLFSSQIGMKSYTVSNWVGEVIADTPLDVLVVYMKDTFGFSIRKDAHLFLYFCLGVCSTLVGIWIFRTPLKQFCGAFLFCTLAAAFDEWHQTFIPERNGRWQDILIDAIGFGSAILIVLTANWLWKCRRANRSVTVQP